MNDESRRWHSEYEAALPIIRNAVDAAYTAVRHELIARGFTCATDDQAEVLVAAIMEYLTESAEPDLQTQRKENDVTK